jgi:predicted nucleic acid-binding protein
MNTAWRNMAEQILLDTNVLLDVLLKRDPWVTESSAVWQAHDDGRIVGFVMACALADIFYIARRLKGLEAAQAAVRICLEAFEICTVDRQALEQALSLPGNDFEDNLQIACASLAGLDVIVTRDQKGFQAASLPALTPAELLTQLNQTAN